MMASTTAPQRARTASARHPVRDETPATGRPARHRAHRRWGRRPSHAKEARMSVAMPRTLTRGVVYVHSTPKALCPHVVWAMESVLGVRVAVDWTDQPAAPGL